MIINKQIIKTNFNLLGLSGSSYVVLKEQLDSNCEIMINSKPRARKRQKLNQAFKLN